LAKLFGHTRGVWTAEFSPDGKRVVTASFDKTARVWDAATGGALATLAGHDDLLRSAYFSPDGERVVTASKDNMARVWMVLPSNADSPPEWFPDFLRYIAQMRLNADGKLEELGPEQWLTLRERLKDLLSAPASRDRPYMNLLRHYLRE
jgi:WD40 repeat protein